MSVFVDVELQFTPMAPIDPIGPLKNVTYSEDCEGVICDLSDVQILPGKIVVYDLLTPPILFNCVLFLFIVRPLIGVLISHP